MRALLLGELKARNRAGNHVFLNLNQVGIRVGHAENRVDARSVRDDRDDAGPVVLIDAAAEPALDRRRCPKP